METREINIKLTISRRGALSLLTLFFLCWHPGFIGSETLSLTTYYPAPYGGYVSLLTSGGTAVNQVNTLLVRDAGRLGIGTGNIAVDSKVHIRIPQNPGFIDGVQIADDLVGADTRNYASFGVTRAAGGNNNAYIGMTKSGTYPWAFGVAGTNDLIMGASSPAGSKVISTPMFRLSTGGDVAIGGNVESGMRLRVQGNMRVTGDLTVDGNILNLCSRVGYGTGGLTSCPVGRSVIGFLGDGVARVSGFLPANSTTSNVGRYVVMGEDWGGTMVCCKL